MTEKNLILILGDQLSMKNPALASARPGIDTLVLAEVAEEASYVRHNRHKMVLLFSAMRHFAAELRTAGFEVIYFSLQDGVSSLYAACERALATCGARCLRICAPGEYRLWSAMAD